MINPNITPLQGLITRGDAPVLQRALSAALKELPRPSRPRSLSQLYQLA